MPRAMSLKSSIAAKRKRGTMRQDRADAALSSSRKGVAASHSSVKSVLVVDVGGTSVKILATGQAEGPSFRSGPMLTPRRMVSGVKKLAADWRYDVVSIGYPGCLGLPGRFSVVVSAGSAASERPEGTGKNAAGGCREQDHGRN